MLPLSLGIDLFIRGTCSYIPEWAYGDMIDTLGQQPQPPSPEISMSTILPLSSVSNKPGTRMCCSHRAIATEFKPQYLGGPARSLAGTPTKIFRNDC